MAQLLDKHLSFLDEGIPYSLLESYKEVSDGDDEIGEQLEKILLIAEKI